MDVVGEGLDAVGEILGVDDDVAGSVAADLPAIVDNDVFVAGVLHAAGDEGVGCRLDEILGDIAAETVPTVPAHGRSESQTIFQGARRWNAKKNSTCARPGGTQKRIPKKRDSARQRVFFINASMKTFRLILVSFLSRPNDKTAHARRERTLRA